MSPKIFLALTVLLIMAGFVMVDQRDVHAGEVTPTPGYKVLEPIRHGNLTVFPVVAAKSYPTGEFLTLDEGLRSGEVVVTEAGSVQGLIRRHVAPAVRHDGRRSESTRAGQQFQAPAAAVGRRNRQRTASRIA